MDKDKLMEIEKGFWHEGGDYYEEYISDDALFVFPGMRLNKEDGVASADKAPRWEDLTISKEKLIKVSSKAAILTYHAKGKRKGQYPYEGDITTVYRMEKGEPKMVFHQHTPNPE